MLLPLWQLVATQRLQLVLNAVIILGDILSHLYVSGLGSGRIMLIEPLPHDRVDFFRLLKLQPMCGADRLCRKVLDELLAI